MEFIQGIKTSSISRIRDPKTGIRDYAIEFFKNSRPIARMFYHPGAKQIVMDIHPEMSLIRTTVESIMIFYNLKTFRTHRRLRQSQLRKFLVNNLKEKANDRN